jgi:hypothetical protein
VCRHVTHRTTMSHRLGQLAFALVLLAAVAMPTHAGAVAHRSFATLSPRSLVSVVMTSPTRGFGLLETISGRPATCRAWVASTDDGGARFHGRVAVGTWACGNDVVEPFDALATDGVGDEFVFGNGLYVSHDAGATWTSVRQPGRVVQVRAIGRSVWLLEALCAAHQTLNCTLRVVTSDDGGRTFHLAEAQPFGALVGRLQSAGTGSSLLRVNDQLAYVVSQPRRFGARTVPIWVTDNAGASWHERFGHCAVGIFEYPIAAAAPNGALFLLCAGEGGAGSQLKSASVSYDQAGRWQVHPSCQVTGGDLCGGYAGPVDAESGSTIFEYSGRGGVLLSHDAGRTWASMGTVGNVSGALGPVLVHFFNASDGIVAGCSNTGSAPVTFWSTSDGGRQWRARTTSIS